MRKASSLYLAVTLVLRVKQRLNLKLQNAITPWVVLLERLKLRHHSWLSVWKIITDLLHYLFRAVSVVAVVYPNKNGSQL